MELYDDEWQRNLFDAPPMTRPADPETSHEAEAHVRRNLSAAQEAVHAAMLALGPASDEELQRFYDAQWAERGWPPQRCVRKRRKDLVDAGRAVYTGRKVANEVGLNVREWRAI